MRNEIPAKRELTFFQSGSWYNKLVVTRKLAYGIRKKIIERAGILYNPVSKFPCQPFLSCF